MKDTDDFVWLFPSWQGRFDGSRLSLTGLPNEHDIQTLETGVMAEVKLNSLMHLIRSPDSHFLKVPRTAVPRTRQRADEVPDRRGQPSVLVRCVEGRVV
jgi:hypothetical protein